MLLVAAEWQRANFFGSSWQQVPNYVAKVVSWAVSGLSVGLILPMTASRLLFRKRFVKVLFSA